MANVSSQKTNYAPNGEFKSILQDSFTVAKSFKVDYVATEFIFYSILRSGGRTCQLLNGHGVTDKNFFLQIRNNIDYKMHREGFTPKAMHVLNESAVIAQRSGCAYVGAEHYVLAMLNFNCAATLILDGMCDIQDLKRDLMRAVQTMGRSRVEQAPAFEEREREASSRGEAQETREYRDEREMRQPREPEREYPRYDDGRGYQPRQSREGEYYKTAPTIEGTVLESFGIDLTAKARSGKLDPVIGREKETEQIINALNRRNKNSPLLIGEPGTGKSAVVEGLAQRMVFGEVPASLKNKILYSLDLSGIIAGAKYKGEFESRFKEMIKYVQDNNVILFIDEIHNLVSGAKSDGMDASEILKPALARGEIQVIGATTINEYRKYIEKDPALERRFSVITVEPPSIEDSITIIKGLKDTFEAHHCVTITDKAIDAAVRLSDRYITDRFLPDKAIDLIDEAAARARLALETIDKEILKKEDEARDIDNDIDYARSCGRDAELLIQKLYELNDEIDKLYMKQDKIRSMETPLVEADDVARVVAERTGIPVNRLTETERERFLNLENYLHKRIVGQDEAIRCVSQAIRRAMSGINDPDKPNGTFLFVGPTGVGKTELAKALAEALFADESKLIRIDMGEYMEKASVAKLIGAPPGYVGYEEEGQLTEKVRRNKFAVVLFDEIEKAHPDVFNIMLQLLDDGRLTDSKGRLVDFKNTVIILTSNAGAQEAMKRRPGIGFGGRESYEETSVKECYDNALRKQFRPEFLNRIDEIIYFDRLGKRDCVKIASLLLDKVKKRLSEREIKFSYDESVVDMVIETGYNEEYGARPLKRAIRSLIEDEVAERVLSGEIEAGSRVEAVVEKGYIRFYVE